MGESATTDPPKPAVEPTKPEGAVGTATQTLESPKHQVKEETRPDDSRKRKLDHRAVDALRSSTYFKIRSIIKDLRPFFIEVINAPDFRESKAAHVIRKEMKAMMDLTRQMRDEGSFAKSRKVSEEHLAGLKEERHQQNQNGSIPSSSSSIAKENAHVHKEKIPVAADEKIPEVKEFVVQLERQGFQGTYVIGGSPVGWNFLLYPGSELIYYGETKAAFRSRQASNVIGNFGS